MTVSHGGPGTAWQALLRLSRAGRAYRRTRQDHQAQRRKLGGNSSLHTRLSHGTSHGTARVTVPRGPGPGLAGGRSAAGHTPPPWPGGRELRVGTFDSALDLPVAAGPLPPAASAVALPGPETVEPGPAAAAAAGCRTRRRTGRLFYTRLSGTVGVVTSHSGSESVTQ